MVIIMSRMRAMGKGKPQINAISNSIEEGEWSEDTDDNKSAITTSSQQNTPSQGKTNRSSPVKKLHKMYRKQLENTPGGKNLPSKESGESKLSMGSQGNKETSSLVPP